MSIRLPYESSNPFVNNPQIRSFHLVGKETSVYQNSCFLRYQHIFIKYFIYAKACNSYLRTKAFKVGSAGVACPIVDITFLYVRRQPAIKSQIVTINV